MLLLIAILILLLTPLAMLIIHLVRPRFSYHWLVAVAGAGLAWPMVLISRPSVPHLIPLMTWQPEAYLTTSPILLNDSVSWSYGLAISTLALVIVLTAVARMGQSDWRAWVGTLSLAGMGLLAALAGNPITMLMAWAALDGVELLILLALGRQSVVREEMVLAFSARVAGIFLLLLAWMVAMSSGETLAFDAIPPSTILLLLSAAGVRLGVLSLHMPFTRRFPFQPDLGTALRLIPAATSLVLLGRIAISRQSPTDLAVSSIAQGVMSDNLTALVLAFSALAALVGGVLWVMSNNELDGRPYWVLGMASLSMAAAIRAQPEASQAFGLAMILAGGVLFLYSVRHRFLMIFPILGLLGFTALPFTPAWEGVQVYSPLIPLSVTIVFLLAHALLLTGYLKHFLRTTESLSGIERWVWVIYPLGLGLLVLVQFSWLLWKSADLKGLLLTVKWEGLATIGLAVLFWFVNLGFLQKQQIGETTPVRFISLRWLFRIFLDIYRFTGRLVSIFTLILEGEGGVLWALVLLILLFSLLLQRGLGG